MTLGQVVNGGFNPPLPLVRYGYRPADAAIQRAPGLEPQVALQRCNGNTGGLEPWSEVYTGTLRHGVRIRSPGGIRNPRERISSKMFAREDPLQWSEPIGRHFKQEILATDALL